MHFDQEPRPVGVGGLDIDADAALVRIGIDVLLGGVPDIDDPALRDEFLQEQGEQALAAWEFFEGPFEPVVEQDVGIDAFGLAGDVLDAGLFEAEGVVRERGE